MRNNKRQLLTVFLVLTLVVPLAAACGPTPEPQVVKETVVDSAARTSDIRGACAVSNG
jgi:hypothetical protein